YKNKKAVSKDIVLDKIEELKFPKLSKNIYAEDEDLSYDYLTNLKIFDITPEEMAKLQSEYDKVMEEYKIYKNTSEKDIWISELNEFEIAYKKWLKKSEDEEKQKKVVKKRAPRKQKQ